jgi:uncharacterized membrane protein YgcG
MIDTSRWPRIELGVLKDIHLDPRNVRLETASARIEADIMEDLFINESTLNLVDGIAKVGFLTHETPIVLKRNGKYVVVEGNRRIAALKAIQNPHLVPTHQARIASLIKLIPDTKALSKISVLVAPNQTVADQVIASIHTGNLRKPWTPARQAAFFQGQIEAGRTLAQLLDRYPTIDVRDFVLQSRVFELLAGVQYGDDELQDFTVSKEFKKAASTLRRIYQTKDFVELTGLKLDDKGDISTALNKAQLKHVATVVVKGIKSGDLDTRSLNTVASPRFKQLMDELRGEAPASSQSTSGSGGGKSGSGTKGTGGGGKGTGGGSAGGSPVVPPKKAKRAYLDLNQIVMPKAFPAAVQLHLQELSMLNFRSSPNTAFLALRALLEKSIKAYAESINEDIKNKYNNNGYVQLHHALHWLEDHFKANQVTALVQPTKRLRDGKLANYTNSADALNAANHNHHFSVDGDEVLDCWHSMEPIIRQITKP